MIIAENRIRNSFRSGGREDRRESVRIRFRECEVLVIVRQVLGIDRKAQELVVLVTDTSDPALEVERIDVNVSVRLHRFELTEERKRRVLNVKRPQEILALLNSTAVVQERRRQRVIVRVVAPGSNRRE